MSGLTPYLNLDGTARAALSFYADVFGGAVELHTFADFNRTDGPPELIAHGYVQDGPVRIYISDAVPGEPAFSAQGLMFSLLGTADPATMRTWFARLADGGKVVDDLQTRPWGASDGRVIDQFGVQWLIGFGQDSAGG